MTPPLTCPRPGPRNPGPDCPLWDARERIRLQRLVELEVGARPSLAQHVWVDFNHSYQRPASPPTRPVPVSPKPVAALNPGPTPSMAPFSGATPDPTKKGAPRA